ncbi:MAG: UDP-N-acetylenolpyruvoylglucosamine reductase [Desulfobulbus propionicus]|nr:MAG: UDP-N-acetylenolpyruvoylglucosamine reductase [Desulfobulbus propionicus]
MDGRQRQQLARRCRAVEWDVDMGTYSTLRTGGRAAALVRVENKEELRSVVQWLNQQKLPWQPLGGGSNILVASDPFPGVFVKLAGCFTGLELMEHTEQQKRVKVGAGCRLAQLIAFCRQESLTGMEWATGIPGTVGGAILMNAGAHGGQVADCLHAVTVFTQAGKEQELAAEELSFGYRKTVFPGRGLESMALIVNATCTFHPGDTQVIEQRCRECSGWRRQHQPLGKGSAGSFFKNPPGDAAGRLIEAAGLKGTQIGGALVSEQHANFIVNTGTATPRDIVALKELVQQRVEEQFGILLEPEVHIY